jgi:hypothetical protein
MSSSSVRSLVAEDSSLSKKRKVRLHRLEGDRAGGKRRGGGGGGLGFGLGLGLALGLGLGLGLGLEFGYYSRLIKSIWLGLGLGWG